MSIGIYAIPIFILTIFVLAVFKKINAYDSFVEGAGEGIHTAFKLLPSLSALIISVEFFSASGLSQAITDIISPVTTKLGFPAEIVPLMLMRPISGSGATAVLTNIYSRFGPDSRIGLIASVLSASTETTLYSMSVYYGSCGVKKTGCTLLASLISDFTAVIVSIITVTLIFS